MNILENRKWTISPDAPAVLSIESGRIFFVSREDGQWFVRQSWNRCSAPEHIWMISGCSSVSYHIAAAAFAKPFGGGLTLELRAGTVEEHPRYPHADALGNRIEISVPGGDGLMAAQAAFYWDTLMPCVVERSAECYPDGYVLSTLQTSVYGGTYPDVDHEFQCCGRIAMSGDLDLDLVRRMIELQCRLMREDPAGLWRNPCSLQPTGVREYHMRRNSMDMKTNAVMFLITGNVEVLQSAWLYVASRKDLGWLRAHIEDLEGAASLTESLLDPCDRLWSDVYYEDQVMKDGAECMSAALAAHAFGQLAELELLLDRKERAAHYRDLELRISRQLVKPVPMGFWDGENRRFIDWLDRNGDVHDHLHLLSNELPVLLGYADGAQAAAVDRVIQDNLAEFQRFPTFMAARIQDYTDSEIGDGGPYDLCAAGRYWRWDAAYWQHFRNGEMLGKQLSHVAAQGETDGYHMGERYDMNHVYYTSDINWHGAAYYYEYPNVFLWVLIHDYLGVQPCLEADLKLQPLVPAGTEILLESAGVAYRWDGVQFIVRNLRKTALSLNVDLSGVREDAQPPTLSLEPGEEKIL